MTEGEKLLCVKEAKDLIDQAMIKYGLGHDLLSSSTRTIAYGGLLSEIGAEEYRDCKQRRQLNNKSPLRQ